MEHASFGITPSRAGEGAEESATSSLKLKQYECLEVPVVFPTLAVANSRRPFVCVPTLEPRIERAIGVVLESEFA